MNALAMPALGLASRAASALPGLFAEMPGRSIAAQVARIDTVGHSVSGKGAGTYIADALADEALLTAHPAFVFRSANRRIFRLLPAQGALAVEQGGAVADGFTNDQPAIQAAIDYAEAVGARAVHFEGSHYALHATERTSPSDAIFAVDGHPIVVTRSLSLVGTGPNPALLDFKGVDGVDPETHWQTIATSAGDASPQVWRGGGVFILGETSEPTGARRVGRVELERLRLHGNRQRTGQYEWPADPATGDGWDVSDKAIWLQDSYVGTLVVRDVEAIGWKGEIAFISGPANAVERIELDRCRFLTTNGNAWNPGPDTVIVARDCEFGDAFQAQEDIAKSDATYHNCIWRDATTAGLGGGPTGLVAYNAVFPTRDDALSVPMTRLNDCEFRNIEQLQFASWVMGRIRTVDCSIIVDGNQSQAVQDIDLHVDAWIDRADLLVALSLFGPSSLTEQVPGAPDGVYKEPIRHCRFALRHYRSELAAREGRQWRPVLWTGHVDPSCRIVCEGDYASQTVPHGGHLPLSMPYVAFDPHQPTTMYTAHGFYNHPVLSADAEITVTAPMMTLQVESEVEIACTLARWPVAGPGFGYGEGQTVRFVKEYATGSIRFAKAANGVSQAVTQDRVLDAAQDWIEFRFNLGLRRWEECGFFTSV